MEPSQKKIVTGLIQRKKKLGSFNRNFDEL
jgi:hypothetical protein